MAIAAGLSIPTKNRSRERMKSELASLRAQVERLEAELEQHRRRSYRRDAAAIQRSASTAEAIRRRHEAERENQQLHAALARQIQVGQQLMDALSGQAGTPFVGQVAARSEPTNGASHILDETSFRISDLVDEIDRACSEANAIFGQGALMNEQPLLFNNKVIDGREQFATEVHGSVANPFALNRCAYS